MTSAAARTVSRHRFTMEGQAWFASLSHDCNPMHVDLLAARRTQYGVPVVHGIHLVLWALESFVGNRPEFRPVGIQVRFLKPVLVGDTVRVEVAAENPREISLQVSVGDIPSLSLRLLLDAPRGIPDVDLAHDMPEPTPLRDFPLDLPLEQLRRHRGAFRYDPAPLAAAFPRAAAALGTDVVGGLAAASYVIGMECPGLHSLFGGIDAAFCTQRPSALVAFKVAKFDARFRRVDLAFRAPGIAAMLSSIGRVAPVAQQGMADLAPLVRPDEFAGQRALVVGGSRGIGEVTAKLLTLGGAKVAVTYATGAADAQRVANDIRSAGGDASILSLDVRQPIEAQIARLDLTPNTLHYFATGPIFRRKLALYEPEVMREFATFYVDGFYNVCMALKRRSGGQLIVFYPSTVAADVPFKGLAEYAASKLAGEMLCAHLNAFVPGITTVIKRLPRTNTDQTVTIAPVTSASPADVMLPILRDVQARLSKSEEL